MEFFALETNVCGGSNGRRVEFDATFGFDHVLERNHCIERIGDGSTRHDAKRSSGVGFTLEGVTRKGNARNGKAYAASRLQVFASERKPVHGGIRKEGHVDGTADGFGEAPTERCFERHGFARKLRADKPIEGEQDVVTGKKGSGHDGLQELNTIRRPIE